MFRSHFGSSHFGSSNFGSSSSVFDPKPRDESSWASQLAVCAMKFFACMLCATFAEYCAKAIDPEGTCLSKAQMKFVINGFNKNDAVVKVAEYCTKANDPKGICLSKAQTTFFNHGSNRMDSIVRLLISRDSSSDILCKS